jgi:uncharacterized protein YwqG
MKKEAEKLIEKSKLLPKIKVAAKEHLRYSIRLNTELVEPGSLPLGKSRIGGRPDLPPNVEWPYVIDDGDYEPLMFVAQINFEDLAEVDRDDVFPKKGILYFWDDYNGRDDAWKVLFYEGETEILTRTANPRETDQDDVIDRGIYDDIRLNECAIRFIPEWMVPPPENKHMWDVLNFQPSDKCREQNDEYYDLYETILALSPSSTYHRILGYADGWLSYDIHYYDGEEEWLLLLQLQDDSKAKMSWGDGGCLNYFIHPEDLKHKRFDRIYRWWEQGC